MGWDVYMRGNGPRTVPEFRAEIRAKITVEVLAEATTGAAFYFAIREVATAHAAEIWNVAEGDTYVTVLAVPYSRPARDMGFGKGNAYDESGGPSASDPPRKILDLLTDLRPLSEAEIAYRDTSPWPYPAPEGIKEAKVWAHGWRDRAKAGIAAADLVRAIKPGVTVRTAGRLRFRDFDEDTFLAVEGRTRKGGKTVHYRPASRPDTLVRLGKTNLVGASIQ